MPEPKQARTSRKTWIDYLFYFDIVFLVIYLINALVTGAWSELLGILVLGIFLTASFLFLSEHDKKNSVQLVARGQFWWPEVGSIIFIVIFTGIVVLAIADWFFHFL